MIAAIALQRLVGDTRRIFWVYLALIGVAELITAAISSPFGLIVHAFILIELALYSATAPHAHKRRLAMALMLAPLTRLLALTLPLAQLPQIAWYPVMALPLIAALAVVSRHTGFSRQQLGLNPGWLPVELAMGGFGFGLGIIEYLILRPNAMIDRMEWLPWIIAALSLLIFTGFTEELLFRGLLQSATLRVLDREAALIYGALLFALLHIGYLSAIDVGFVFVVGIIFGVIVLRTGSILGVSLAHGMTNITLFLLMPYAIAEPESAATQVIWGIIGIGSLIGFIAVGLAMHYGRSSNVEPA